jgi:hypothetical protein
MNQEPSSSPLVVVLVNVDAQTFSKHVPSFQPALDDDISQPPIQSSASRLWASEETLWVGQKFSNNFLRSFLQFKQWINHATSPVLLLRMHSSSSCSPLRVLHPEKNSQMAEERFISISSDADAEAHVKVMENIAEWQCTGSTGLAVATHPTVLVVGGWTDRHLYHTCYELRRHLGRKARVGMCSTLAASAREESHWAALDRIADGLGVKVCLTVVETIGWCMEQRVSIDLVRALATDDSKDDLDASARRIVLSAPELRWATDIPAAFHHEIDTEILSLLFRGSALLHVAAIGGGMSTSLVLSVQYTSATGQRGAPSVVKIDTSRMIAGEYIAFSRVEDHLGNNAPQVKGFVDLGTRAGIRFRYTGMAYSSTSRGGGGGGGNTSSVVNTLCDSVTRMQPNVREFIDDIYDVVFESWYVSAQPRQFSLLRYYCAGFESSIGRATSVAHMDSEEARLVTGFLLHEETKGGAAGRYHRKEPRFYTCPTWTSPYVQFQGLPRPVRNLADLLDGENMEDGLVLVGRMPPQPLLSTFAHGDANVRNFLLDGKSNIWVIDFALSHPDNHVLRDLMRTLTSGE